MKQPIRVTLKMLLPCILSFVMISSCEKTRNQLQITLENPFDFGVLVELNDLTEVLRANSSETISRPIDGKTVNLSAWDNWNDKHLGSTSFELEKDEVYTWVVGSSSVSRGKSSGSNNSGGGSSSNLPNIVGKWSSATGCKNAAGESSYFQFYSNKTAVFFNSDCNSVCQGYGINFHFNYEQTATTIKINYSKTDPYCGRSVDVPKPETANYSLSGNVLTINGDKYQKR